jgi:hypothetical protein
MSVPVTALHPRVTMDHIGMIPAWLSENNPAKAAQQLHAAYGHGGGWQPFNGFTLTANNSLTYPGDPALKPIAEMRLRDELILMYEHAWVAIIQPDRSFEVCRMD